MNKLQCVCFSSCLAVKSWRAVAS
uniref:Uncharacterized protein n=1 Tax=Anguilla anguilla TaxID=7936 RepID=A0A0E9TIE9_ANGAN